MCSAKNYKLTQRDLKIPALVEDYHLLTTSQIQKLLFPSLQKAQSRCLRVYQNGLIDRFRYPVLLVEGGRGEFVYHINRMPKFSYTGIVHTIELNEIRIAFELASKRSEGINLVDFIPEYRGFIDEEGRIRRLTEDKIRRGRMEKAGSIIPDAVVCLENSNNNKILMFVELDLATEKLVTKKEGSYSLLKKMLLYREYGIQGGFKKYNSWFNYQFKGFCSTTFVIPAQRQSLFPFFFVA